MQIASQPEATIYGGLMMYVNFVPRASGHLDDAWASTSGQAQPEPKDGSTKCAASEDCPTHNFVRNEGAES